MRLVKISSPNNIKHMKNFNAQYGKHSRLELLKHFILEHGTYIELKKGEQFSVQGKMNRRGAYIENGLLRYTRVDERGNIHIVGYTFSEEFAGSLCTFINPDRPSLVTIEAVCDSKIYYLPYSTAEEFFTTNAETMQIKCTLVEQSYLLMYHRLLDMYCKTTEELYLDLLNRCPDIQEHITLKEVASFLQVTPETISRIRHKLNKCIRCKLEK